MFAALKLIEQLHIDGHISHKELLGIVHQNVTILKYEDFVAKLGNREAA